MSKDRDEFVAVMAREIPDLAAHHVAELAGSLIRWGSVAGRNAVRLCNGDVDQDEYEKVKDRTVKRIDALWKYYGDLEYMKGKFPKIEYTIGGDPRGFTLKLLFPSKRHNTWGGEEAGY